VAIGIAASADLESADLRYEKIPKNGRTSHLEYCMRSRPQVLSIRLRAAPFVCVYVNRTQVEGGQRERERKREWEGKKERERDKSGRPSKTGRTGFSGRVGESLYSVSLFLCGFALPVLSRVVCTAGHLHLFVVANSLWEFAKAQRKTVLAY